VIGPLLMSGQRNLNPSPWPEPSWREPDLETSLHEIYRWVEQEAVRSAEWYLSEKRTKGRWSRWLRLVAIGFATAGAALPLVAAAADGVNAQWGYVLLAATAGALAVDRFFGFSSAWMRYVAAQLAIQSVLDHIRFQRAVNAVRREGRQPTSEEVAAELESLEKAAVEMREEVRAETFAGFRSSRAAWRSFNRSRRRAATGRRAQS